MGPDENAEFVAFVLAAQPRLRRTAYLICGDWHRAEDIVQTALTQMHSRWARLCSTGDGPGGYVHRAVVNAAIDERRRPWRRERPTDYVPDRAAPPTDGLTVEVIEALSALPCASARWWSCGTSRTWTSKPPPTSSASPPAR